FDDWQGPRYLLRASEPGDWSLAPGGESALVVGRDDTLRLVGQNTLCVERVEVHSKGGGTQKLLWKSPAPDGLKVTVPMMDAAPGPVALSIYQYGQKKPQTIRIEAYADAAALQLLTLSAGDEDATLTGTRLDEVAKADFDGIDWKPGTLTRVQDTDQLTLETGASTSKLKPGKRYEAHVQLLDGRKLKVPVAVEAPRPQAVLLSKGVQTDPASQPSPVTLGSPNDLPFQGRLVFFLKSTSPPNFSRDEKVEVAAGDGGFHTTLDFSNGGLLLEDASTAMGSLDALKSFGYSAFGPVQLRVISADGAAGDWMPLGTLVRLPEFAEMRCPRAFSRPCTLSGTNLFLAASFSSTQDFANPTTVPLDFTGTELSVPHPDDGVLYLKLRDDPATVQTLNMPVTWVPARLRLKPRREPVPEEPTPAAAPPSTAPSTAPPAASSTGPATQPPANPPVLPRSTAAPRPPPASAPPAPEGNAATAPTSAPGPNL
ncbi:MAG: hypothetical protein ACRD27_09330, partial [Terracidiphilus sp.]